MPRLQSFFALCAGLILAQPALCAKPSSSAATAILVDGTVTLKLAATAKALNLGQHLGASSALVSTEASSVHLVLANGASLVLGANSEVSLKLSPGPRSEPHFSVVLKRGTLYWMADPTDKPASFDLSTPEAALQFKVAHFELSSDNGETRVQVASGDLQLGDLGRKRFETVGALESTRIFSGRLERASRSSKREAGDLRARWQRSELFHQQRAELMKQFK